MARSDSVKWDDEAWNRFWGVRFDEEFVSASAPIERRLRAMAIREGIALAEAVLRYEESALISKK